MRDKRRIPCIPGQRSDACRFCDGWNKLHGRGGDAVSQADRIERDTGMMSVDIGAGKTRGAGFGFLQLAGARLPAGMSNPVLQSGKLGKQQTQDERNTPAELAHGGDRCAFHSG